MESRRSWIGRVMTTGVIASLLMVCMMVFGLELPMSRKVDAAGPYSPNKAAIEAEAKRVLSNAPYRFNSVTATASKDLKRVSGTAQRIVNGKVIYSRSYWFDVQVDVAAKRWKLVGPFGL